MGAAEPSEHYFSDAPGAAHKPQQVRCRLAGREVVLHTDAGVFSASRLDPGTAVLLGAEVPVATGDLLDLGCGYGPIAVALALHQPDATVWAVDVNERARSLARRNAAALGVADQVRVCSPAEVPADITFRQIWSNPPIRIGKPALHDLLNEWLIRLDARGEARLVVARNLGADSLARWLTEEGWETKRELSRKGYRVLHVSPALLR